MERTYLCIDLKSFYASVECVDRNLDPLTTNLVVADESRTEKTICLAVTPSLKAYGISGRARLFEVIQTVKNVNAARKRKAPNRSFTKKSYDALRLKSDPSLEVDYIVARPRMAHYMQYSAKIYEIYLKYVSDDDILVYSIDEVFMDITNYIGADGKNANDFARAIICDVLDKTGITATAGIGTNMYLAKIAMDITAKKIQPDEYGVRIAYLDEMSYRRQLWEHRPLTDFWRVGKGYSKKLEENKMYTMGDIALESVTQYGRKKLKKLFGINAKMLIDHAWGYEPCTIAEAKAYTPENRSISSGQVLKCPYDFGKARIIVREMLELLALDLVEKRLVTNQIVLTIGYDRENLTNPEISGKYKGEITNDRYGRQIPKHAHGTANIGTHTSSAKLITEAAMKLYDEIVGRNLLVRRVTVTANNVVEESCVKEKKSYEQMDLFTDYDKARAEQRKEEAELKKERLIQEAIIDIKRKYGKNSVIKGTNLKEGATTIERNESIGGHKA